MSVFWLVDWYVDLSVGQTVTKKLDVCKMAFIWRLSFLVFLGLGCSDMTTVIRKNKKRVCFFHLGKSKSNIARLARLPSAKLKSK